MTDSDMPLSHDLILCELLRSYDLEKRERNKDDPALEILWDGIEKFAEQYDLEIHMLN